MLRKGTIHKIENLFTDSGYKFSSIGSSDSKEVYLLDRSKYKSVDTTRLVHSIEYYIKCLGWTADVYCEGGFVHVELDKSKQHLN